MDLNTWSDEDAKELERIEKRIRYVKVGLLIAVLAVIYLLFKWRG